MWQSKKGTSVRKFIISIMLLFSLDLYACQQPSYQIKLLQILTPCKIQSMLNDWSEDITRMLPNRIEPVIVYSLNFKVQSYAGDTMCSSLVLVPLRLHSKSLVTMFPWTFIR
jgi:hypothetical protein